MTDFRVLGSRGETPCTNLTLALGIRCKTFRGEEGTTERAADVADEWTEVCRSTRTDMRLLRLWQELTR